MNNTLHLQTLLFMLATGVCTIHAGHKPLRTRKKRTHQIGPSPLIYHQSTLKNLVNDPPVQSNTYPTKLHMYLKSLDHNPIEHPTSK